MTAGIALQRRNTAVSQPNSNAQKIAQIKQLQIEYKRAALKAKTDQDKTAALAHFKVSKVCFAVIFGLPCITNTIFL